MFATSLFTIKRKSFCDEKNHKNNKFCEEKFDFVINYFWKECVIFLILHDRSCHNCDKSMLIINICDFNYLTLEICVIKIITICYEFCCDILEYHNQSIIVLVVVSSEEEYITNPFL